MPARPGRGHAARLIACALMAGCGARTFLNIERGEVAPDLAAWLGGGGNSFGQVHGHEAFIGDPKMGDFALRFRRAVTAGGVEVSRVLLSHHHHDHAGGLVAFANARVVLVHPNARARLPQYLPEREVSMPFEKERPSRARRVPYVEVERELSLLLGDDDVRVLYLGPGHTDGDLVVFWPKRRLVFTGDLFTSGFEPLVDEGAGGDILELQRTIGRLLELDFDRVIPGHGPLAERADVERLYLYLRVLEKQVRAAVAEGLSAEATRQRVTIPELPLQPIVPGVDRGRNVELTWRAIKAGR